VLGADFILTGLLVDGTSIPISSGAAAAWAFAFYLPLSLRESMLEDGDLFAQGSTRLVPGYVRTKMLANAGNVALGNGTMVVSAVACAAIPAYDPQGAASYVGPTCKFTDPGGATLQADSPQLDAGARFLIIDDAGSAYAGTYTTRDPIESDQVARAAYNNDYNRQWRKYGGDNSCARGTPVFSIRHGLKFHELDTSSYQPKIKNDSGNAQRLLQMFFYLKSTRASQAVARKVSAGGPVSTARVTPATHVGAPVPNRLRGLVGTVAVAGTRAGFTPHASPSAVK
jgi:hypothetical protein